MPTQQTNDFLFFLFSNMKFRTAEIADSIQKKKVTWVTPFHQKTISLINYNHLLLHLIINTIKTQHQNTNQGALKIFCLKF